MVTQEELRRRFHYDPDTGIFTWRVNHRSARRGDIVGTINGAGYRNVSIDRKQYLTHRLIFLYMRGYFPEHCVDHIDGDRSNNRWSNLREVSYSCNNRNKSTPPVNTSGIRGVCWNARKKKWMAYIYYNGNKTLCNTVSLYEAVCARFAAEQCIGAVDCDINSSAGKFIKTYIQSVL